MSRIITARKRLLQAEGLATLLDAAYCAFEDMLSIIRDHEDPADGMFIPLVMAAAAAADGRDAIAFAPSLPPRRLHTSVPGEEPDRVIAAPEVARALAALSGLLATRLEDPARSAPGHADQSACRDAARYARDVQALLSGGRS